MMVIMEVNVIIEESFKGKISKRWLRDVASAVLATENVDLATEMGVLITDQDHIKELNWSYRGLNEPTDVLSFYMFGETKPDDRNYVPPPDNVRHLGEVIISYPQAVTQAKEHHHRVKKEIAFLIIHGILHLLEYDHHKAAEVKRMQSRETAILNKIGVLLK